MRRLAPLAALALAACATPPSPTDEEFVWVCPGGTFTIRFDDSYTTAFIYMNGTAFRLNLRSAAADMRFAEGKLEFWESLHGAHFTGAPGGDLLDCELGED